MDNIEKIKEYALKHYKKHFTKQIILKNDRGQYLKTQFFTLDPLISITDTHIEINILNDHAYINLNDHIWMVLFSHTNQKNRRINNNNPKKLPKNSNLKRNPMLKRHLTTNLLHPLQFRLHFGR